MFRATAAEIGAGVVFSLLVTIAAVWDVRTRRIPNLLVVTLAILGMVYSAVLPMSLSGGLRGLEGITVALLCWLPLYALGWLGAGDVKLFAAAGAWLGPLRTVEGSLIAALLGAALAIVWMVRSRGIRKAVETIGIAATLPSILGNRVPAEGTPSLPYGVAMAAGALYAAWSRALLLS